MKIIKNIFSHFKKLPVPEVGKFFRQYCIDDLWVINNKKWTSYHIYSEERFL